MAKQNTNLIFVGLILLVIFFAFRGQSNFMGSVADLREGCTSTESLYTTNYIDDFKVWINKTCTDLKTECTSSGGTYNGLFVCTNCASGKYSYKGKCLSTNSSITAACSALSGSCTSGAFTCAIANTGGLYGDICQCKLNSDQSVLDEFTVREMLDCGSTLSACDRVFTCGSLLSFENGKCYTDEISSVKYFYYSANYSSKMELYSRETTTAAQCEEQILNTFINNNNAEPITLGKDGRRIYTLNGTFTNNQTAKNAWCSKYGNMLIAGNDTILTKYWHEYIDCPVIGQTELTAICWKKENTTCMPYTVNITTNLTGNRSNYCGSDYYSKVECTRPWPTTSLTATTQESTAGAAFEFSFQRMKDLAIQYKWYILIVAVVIFAYIFWEQGPDRGFFRK